MQVQKSRAWWKLCSPGSWNLVHTHTDYCVHGGRILCSTKKAALTHTHTHTWPHTPLNGIVPACSTHASDVAHMVAPASDGASDVDASAAGGWPQCSASDADASDAGASDADASAGVGSSWKQLDNNGSNGEVTCLFFPGMLTAVAPTPAGGPLRGPTSTLQMGLQTASESFCLSQSCLFGSASSAYHSGPRNQFHCTGVGACNPTRALRVLSRARR